MQHSLHAFVLTLWLCLAAAANADMHSDTPSDIPSDIPKYKPSSSSPTPQAITGNRYGFSRNAPAALAIGEVAANFTLPQAGGGQFQLADVLTKLRSKNAGQGAVVLIFYRGHW